MLTSGKRRTAVFELVCLLIGLLAVGWALGRFSVAVLGGADLSVVRAVAGDRAPALTALAHGLSFLGSGYLLFPAAVVIASGLAAVRRTLMAGVLLAGTLGGVLISNVDKVLVDRPRPPVRHLEHVVSHSFPSGHATQSSAFYVALLVVSLRCGLMNRRLMIAATILVVLGVAASRVYLGVHYPSDVVAGAGLGTFWSCLVGRIMLARRERGPGA